MMNRQPESPASKILTSLLLRGGLASTHFFGLAKYECHRPDANWNHCHNRSLTCHAYSGI